MLACRRDLKKTTDCLAKIKLHTKVATLFRPVTAEHGLQLSPCEVLRSWIGGTQELDLDALLWHMQMELCE